MSKLIEGEGRMSFLKDFLLFLLPMILFFQCALNAASEKAIKSARSDTSEPALKCSPSGESGTLTPGKLAGEQKKGMTILLLAGQYENEIVINADRVIVTGEPGKFCDARLLINGKDCVVKNLWVREIETEVGIACIDSIISRFVVSGYETKADVVFDNCCIGSTEAYSYGKTITYKNCTLCSEGDLFTIGGGRYDFNNCVLYSKDSIFKVTSDNKIKINISNSLVFTKNNFASDYNKRKVANTSKDIKKSKLTCTVTIKNVIEEKPIFALEPGEGEGGADDRGSDRHHWRPNFNPRNFILLDNSPGKKDGFGAKLSPEGYPIPPDSREDERRL